ncbi:hypothetical protein GCWU000324_03145 [Kingella oralis ATCC 51147]|uniref:Uncharacterized protein n=1 Tax=Kingella oralis ATCC 51147 TaxID=629741 RepID=C4GN56_9NEIS|nr:hypothetical protein GCWU000324_03145 [Kingella oralis ATCC 51147]
MRQPENRFAQPVSGCLCMVATHCNPVGNLIARRLADIAVTIRTTPRLAASHRRAITEIFTPKAA